MSIEQISDLSQTIAAIAELDKIEQHRFDAMMQHIVTQAIARGRYAAHVVKLIDGGFAAVDAAQSAAGSRRPA